MNYEFTGLDGVDKRREFTAVKVPSLDYASGARETIQAFSDRGVPCEDPACPLADSIECPLPSPLWATIQSCCWGDVCLNSGDALECSDPQCPPRGDPSCQLPDGGWEPAEKCCLEDVCVVGALDETKGIGDHFSLNLGQYEAPTYIYNRDWQLYWAGYCIHNNVYQVSYGAKPAYPDDAKHELDWNQDGVLDDEQLVGAFLFNPDWPHRCGPWWGRPGQSNVKPYPDIDEWGRVVHFGFRYFGLNQQPALALSPVCGTASAVECPQGFVCSFGRCTAHNEGYLPPDIWEVPTP